MGKTRRDKSPETERYTEMQKRASKVGRGPETHRDTRSTEITETKRWRGKGEGRGRK